MADKRTTASLLPEDAAGGGSIPDGDYTIKEIQTDLFDYNGQVPEGVPVILVSYRADDGTDYEQPYKAGDNAHLEPSEDKTHFVHPNRKDTPSIYKGGAAHMWLSSLAKAGFPRDKFTDNVTTFKGIKVSLTNVAAPKGKTADGKEGKTIPIVSKILSMGKGTAPAKTTAPARAAAPAPAEANGEPSELDMTVIGEVQKILANGPTTRLKLGTSILTAVAKYKGSKDADEAAAFKQLATIQRMAKDVNWLTQNAELGGWQLEGDAISLVG